MDNQIQNQFREDEIAFIRHFDKQRQEWVANPYPKVGGRLRLAHEATRPCQLRQRSSNTMEQPLLYVPSVPQRRGHLRVLAWPALTGIKLLLLQSSNWLKPERLPDRLDLRGTAWNTAALRKSHILKMVMGVIRRVVQNAIIKETN